MSARVALTLSQLFLAIACGLAVYLTATLKTTRRRLTDLERAQVVLDTQLSIAAEIRDLPDPRTPERLCDVLMELAHRGHGPRDVENWQDDRTVRAIVFDGVAVARADAA